ncbi:signal recognition particle SRP9 SRP14 subunit [Gilbertella persicaria]|uniref:signal recognition particle SRP9 SRP14 subunit n=1 Tax=Gilbertella persicaria TaxID=101096 RepID=UPI002220C5D8|nr:signal recognition particle SRP9 SRP14 subunit [Gilbertella persicaria]KAI8081937.1 signal recognition particle SRP9 SRP14 subunit [Gilbertella persicaria]
MYITNWEEFQKAAEDIYTASPEQTRYVHTFHRSDGDLVLKVTDDRTNVKYKTNQMTDLKKFIHLNNELMLKMMNKEKTDPDTVIPDAPATKSIVPEVKTASPKQTPKGGKKGKKRR